MLPASRQLVCSTALSRQVTTEPSAQDTVNSFEVSAWNAAMLLLLLRTYPGFWSSHSSILPPRPALSPVGFRYLMEYGSGIVAILILTALPCLALPLLGMHALRSDQATGANR